MTTHANRGMTLEKAIEQTCHRYKIRGAACIDKVNPRVIQKREGNRVHLVRLKSTVDFDGVCCGIPVAFDAKQTNEKRLDRDNIHDHQLTYLHDFTRCRGLGFLLVMFAKQSEVFAVTPAWYEGRLEELGRASVPIAEFHKHAAVRGSGCSKIVIGAFGVPVHFAPAVQELWVHLLAKRKSA